MLTLQGPGGVAIRGRAVNFTSNGPLHLTAQVTSFISWHSFQEIGDFVYCHFQVLQISSNRGIHILDRTTPTTSNHTQFYHVCLRANGTLFLVPRNPFRCGGNTPTWKNQSEFNIISLILIFSTHLGQEIHDNKNYQS